MCYEEHKVVAIKDLHQKDSGLSPTLVSVNLVYFCQIHVSLYTLCPYFIFL